MAFSDQSCASDIIILGGGCAGLSLASRLANQNHSSKLVVVLEARPSYSADRTWCGWRTEPHFFSDCVKLEWNQWQVVTPKATFRRGSATYPYELITADCFYNKACRLLSASQTVDLILGANVRQVSLSENNATINLTDGRTFSAPWVIDTRPPQRVIRHPWIWQNFVGYVVHFDRNSGVDLDDIPTLMDFQPPEASVAQFVYLLPLSSNSYLCEWTRLSPEHGQLSLIEAKLIQWLRHRAGASWRLVRRESGSLPMALPLAECRERVVSAGTRGGSMRASSGYAFHAIQRWAEACTLSIVATGVPIAPARSRLLESLDASFLSVLQQETASAANLFGQLFADCEPDALVRFLAGIPRASDFWPVIRSLPWAQFLPTVPLLVSTLCRA